MKFESLPTGERMNKLIMPFPFTPALSLGEEGQLYPGFLKIVGFVI